MLIFLPTQESGLIAVGYFPPHSYLAIQKEVWVLLPTYMARSADSREAFKELVIEQIAHSEEVERKWTLISQCIDVEDDAIELL